MSERLTDEQVAAIVAMNDGWERATPLAVEVQQWRALAPDLIGPDDCDLDHHGYCQNHMWLDLDCPVARAKALLAGGPT